MVYNELLGAWDGRNGLHVLLDEPNGSRIGWNILDPVDGDGRTSGRVDTIRRMLPHLRQLVRVREALAGARALGASALALLDHAGAGVIGLDRGARITAVNDRASELPGGSPSPPFPGTGSSGPARPITPRRMPAPACAWSRSLVASERRPALRWPRARIGSTAPGSRAPCAHDAEVLR